jgi:hypothetical protein
MLLAFLVLFSQKFSLLDNADVQIILNKVLLVSTRDKAYIGMPVVTNAAVHAVVEEQVCPLYVVGLIMDIQNYLTLMSPQYFYIRDGMIK